MTGRELIWYIIENRGLDMDVYVNSSDGEGLYTEALIVEPCLRYKDGEPSAIIL